MKAFRSLSAVEQLTAHLREEIQSGGLEGKMPGVAQLVRRLGVGTKTVVAAMDILRREGVLEALGERKSLRIADTHAGIKPKLRVRILLYEENDAHNELIVRLGSRLEQRGYQVAHATKSLSALKFDLKQVIRMVEKEDGDAWVIVAGSRPVLEWFAARSVPAFALFGRQSELPIARLATVKSPAMSEAVRRLVALGHRRIVMLVHEERRIPTPGMTERHFLEVIQGLGIDTGIYNLPDWEDNASGLGRCLDALFRHTPPTAIFLGEPDLFFATQQYLLRKRLVVPDDVSLITMEDHPAFEWFETEVSRISTDTRKWVVRVAQWVENIANGKEDRRETLIQAKFVEGGMIGPAPATKTP